MGLYRFLINPIKNTLKAEMTFRVLTFLLILFIAGLTTGCSVYSAFNTVFNEEWAQNHIIPVFT
ncbi:MAG: hypothetical protein ACOCU7_00665 [Tangfeifania sp.]